MFCEVFRDDLAKEIKTALDHSRGLKSNNVEVQISGRTVVLLGTVSMLSQKEMAETVVRRFGLQDVRNEIFVKW